MQEEIENKTVTLIVNSSKFSGQVLQTAIAKFLAFTKNRIHENKDVKPKGRQSVKKLIAQNQGVSSMEFEKDDDIRFFERYARKYGVDYAVKKADGEKNKFLIFFKARDADAISAAMMEYTNHWKNKSREKKPSVRKLLARFKEMMMRDQPHAKDRDLTR